jgi:glycosyltransferase involved in cell wall biosynthesis
LAASYFSLRTSQQTEVNPVVTIGMPVYNEERFVAEALLSAAEQGAVVIVSDNGSSDGTQQECQRIAHTNPAIRYVRHETNQGAAWNFKYCLDAAATNYFMWFGGHDLLPPGYVDVLATALDSHPAAVLAYPAVKHTDTTGRVVRHYDYSFAQLLRAESALRRMTGVVGHLEDCTLVHGIFRRDFLVAAGVLSFLGGDHVLIAKAAARGPLIYCPQTAYIRRQPHTNDSLQKQLHRIDPGAALPQGNAKARMAEEQLRLYADSSLGPRWSRALWKIFARYELVRRFSPWAGGSTLERVLNQALFLIARISRRLNRLLIEVRGDA